MKQSKEAVPELSPRRATLIEIATGVFTRYGFRKTSMDDVARAAGLSRAGLYLHFANKTELFRAVATEFATRMRRESREALDRTDARLESRLLDAFMAAHGEAVGLEHLEELKASSREVVGDVMRDSDRAFIADVAQALRADEAAASWKKAGLSANELAELLFASSDGIKRIAKSPADYRKRLSVALRLVCHGCDR
jgi:AcrR family transcriptional regulator